MRTRFRSTARLAMALVAVGAVCLAAESTQAQVIRPLTDLKTDGSSSATIDDAGTVVFALSKTDPVGSNPLHASQIFKWTVPGGSASQVGNLRRGAIDISVSDDGAWLAVVSRSDPVGQNHDLSYELFLISSDGATIVQLTNDPALNGGSLIFPLEISGSGNRILFRADTDPLGTNSGRHRQLFVIDTDGTNLTQLTNATGAELGFIADISDDGSRIVFSYSGDLTGMNSDGSEEIFGVLFDGTQLFQHSRSALLNSGEPVISGDGSTIAFSTESTNLYVVNWGSPITTLLGPGSRPSITDDAQFIYYLAPDGNTDEIFKIPTAGGPATLLTSNLPGLKGPPQISGANARIVFTVFNSSSSSFPEVTVMDANGSNIEQLTNNVVDGDDDEPDVTPDGSRIVFQSSGDFTGTGTLSFFEIFRVQADGSDLTQVTTNALASHPTVSADGSVIAFQTSEDLTGQNPCGQNSVFQINADGTGLLQLPSEVNCNHFHVHPEIAADGSFVVFQVLNDGGLYRAPTDGGAVSEIVVDGDAGVSAFKNARLSENGQWVAYHSPTNFDGLNPGGLRQVFRARTDGTLVERLTTGSGAWRPDIDADGNRVVYTSSADPLGTNPDQNFEVFLFDASTATTQQLTFTTSGQSTDPRISGGGEFVYFSSSAPFFETLPTERYDLYRITVATGLIERAAGLCNTGRDFSPINLRDRPRYVADSNGGAVFSGQLIATNINFDDNNQLWFVDFDVPARIRPGKQAPTLVSWDVEPDPVRYDVIRGDVANLQPSGPGEIDLGPVVCIEDDSPDNDTLGSEDVTQPGPGQVLFYVHRGSRGLLAGPGSYDLASDGSERVPASGDCQP